MDITRTQQVGNKNQLMPNGYFLCKHNKEYWWEKDGIISESSWDKWWVRRDALFYESHGYSYVKDEDHEEQIINIIKNISEETHKMLIGECKQCGLCCKENWRFAYKVDCEKELIIPDYRVKKPKNYNICESFCEKTNTCNTHGENKVAVCKYWPILLTDLEQINCPGYMLKG